MRNADFLKILMKCVIKLPVQDDKAVNNIKTYQIPQLLKPSFLLGADGKRNRVIILLGSLSCQQM